MKMRIFAATAVLFLLIQAALPAQTISGVLDSTLNLAAGSGGEPVFSWGIEELANIRLQARVRDKAVFYAAVNFIAAAGSQAFAADALAGYGNKSLTASGVANIPSGAFSAGENYAAALELERLYLRVRGGNGGVDLGLMRMPLGYSLVWGPADFLNPRNPLSENARLRAVLGANASFYPAEDMRLQAFAAAPRDPFSRSGGGLVFGLFLENDWPKASVQGYYAYETPLDTALSHSPSGIHRGSISVKADLVLGFVAEAMYAWNPGREAGIEALSASGGFDYSFLDGSCLVLLEYLFNGAESSTSQLLGLSGSHYLSVVFRYNINDYTRIGLNCAASLEDVSFVPGISFDYDFFQGMSLSLNVKVPLDRDLFAGDGNTGEFGPGALRNYCGLTAGVRLRF